MLNRITERAEVHSHTDFSNFTLPDSTNKVDKLIDKAIEMGLSGLAITDHEILASHVPAMHHIKKVRLDAQKEYDKTFKEDPGNHFKLSNLKKKLAFKVMYGNEIYLTEEGLSRETVAKGAKFMHMILIAKNKEGHRQLRELSSSAWEKMFVFGRTERRPTWPSELERVLSKSKGNIIATTACLGGPLGKVFFDYTGGLITKAEMHSKVEAFIKCGVELFGKEDFYLEIQPGRQAEQLTYNSFLVQIAKKYEVELVVGCDAHYLTKEKRKVHKAFLKSKEGDREVDAFYQDTYLMNNTEIYENMKILGEETVTRALINSIRIADKCEDYDIFSSPHIPERLLSPSEIREIKFLDIYKEKYPYLYRLATSKDIQDVFFVNELEKGLVEKISFEEYEKHFERLEIEASELVEISKILKDNMIKYPNLVQMVVDLAWEEGDSLVGPSRGSAFGYLSHYLLGITNVSPFFHKDIPAPHWRFLSRERSAGLPDVDIDVQSDKRQKIISLLTRKYKSLGGDCVQISTYREEGSRSAIATAARGLGYDYETALFLSSLIVNERGFNRTLSQMYYGDLDKDIKPTQQFIDEIDKFPELFETALEIEGLINGRGVHACGIVLTNEPIYNVAAVMRAPNGALITQFNLSACEDLGLVKIDLLSVEILLRQRITLDLLLKYEQIEDKGSLKKTYNNAIGIETIELEDGEMWQVIKNNRVSSLFQ